MANRKLQTTEIRARYDALEIIARDVIDVQFVAAWGHAFNLANPTDKFALVNIHMRSIEQHIEADTHEDVSIVVEPVAEQINGTGPIMHGWKTQSTIVGLEEYLPLEIVSYYSPESGITVF